MTAGADGAGGGTTGSGATAGGATAGGATAGGATAGSRGVAERGGEAPDAAPAVSGPVATELVAAVVVNYESGPDLATCVTDLARAGLDEVVVVDNGSSDGSTVTARAAVPGLEVIVPGGNLGYGAAANRGVAATSSPFVLVCNSDLEVAAEAVAALSAALHGDPGAALAGPLVRTPTGERYPSARRFPSLVDSAGHALLGIFAPDNRFTRSYQQSDLDAAAVEVRPVDWVSGACFLVRRAAFEGVGGFDESYFMYAEDVDLCWRLGREGWRVLYTPTAEVTHLQGRSTDRHPYRMILEHHRSLLRFASRSSTGWRRALLPLVAAGLMVRTGLACLYRGLRG